MPRTWKYRPRRQNKKKKRSYFKNRSSTGQASQLVKLDKRLTKLSQKVALNRDWFDYYNYYYRMAAPEIVGPSNTYGYTVIPVLDTTSMEQCFDTPTQADLDIDEWTYHGSKIHLRISIGTENTNPIQYTTYLVQLRKDARATAIHNWGNKLDRFFNPSIPGTGVPTSTQANPIMTFSQGQTFINKNVFKVLAVRHANLGEVAYGSNANPVRNIGDTVRDYYFSVKKKVKLGRSQESIETALDNSLSAINRDAQTFIIIVNNDNQIDAGYGQVDALILHKFSANS